MAELQLLQRPPSKAEAEGKALALLDARLPSWNVLLGSNEFDEWARQSLEEASELDNQVCFSHHDIRPCLIIDRSY